MYTDNRDAYRNVFFVAWQKHLKKMPLELEEQRLIDVILEHPEIHQMLDKPESYLKQEFANEENPFLHISMHLALREQIRLDRPNGINEIFSTLKVNTQNSIEAEHLMLPVLATMLSKSQQTGMMPSDAEYLSMLRMLISK